MNEFELGENDIMKILQVNNFYQEGSTGKIVADIKTILDYKGIDSLVCYGRGKTLADKKNGVVRICSNEYAKFCKLLAGIVGVKFSWCHISTNKLISIIKKEKPDVVHLHCINDNVLNIYRIINYLKNNNIPTVLTLHAEFMYTANCGYALDCDKWRTGCHDCERWRKETTSFFRDGTRSSWLKMKKAFDGFNNLEVVSVSSWLEKRAKDSDILSDKRHSVILNGIDTTGVFHITKSNYRETMDLQNKKVVVHVTASFSRPIKGGKYLIELANRMPDVAFILIGNSDTNISLPSNIIDIGRINDQKELAKYYSLADLFVLTSEKETFCMPVAESLCCGTPVVGFRARAPAEIALQPLSEFVPFGDMKALECEVRKWLDKNIDSEIISREATKCYSKEAMTNAYIELYNKMTKNK